MIDRSKTLARVTRECLAVHDKPTWKNLAALMTEEEREAFRGRVAPADAAPAEDGKSDSDVVFDAPPAAESVTDGPAETHPLSKSLENFEPPRANGSAPTHVAPASEAPQPENPYDQMRRAEHDLNVARQTLRDCRTALLKARQAFGIALQTWNNGAPVATHEQQARAFIAQSQADKAARAAANQGGIWHPGITRTARALAGGNQRRGGGAAFRRGAFTKAEALKIESGRLRAAALAAKTPRG